MIYKMTFHIFDNGLMEEVSNVCLKLKKCIVSVRQLAFDMGQRMLCSIYCMHWEWLICPNVWRNQFIWGDQKQPTIILEVMVSYHLWILDAFVAPLGANNDINFLDKSPILNNIYLGKSYDVSFQANGTWYKHGYYLTDRIYLELAVFVKSLTCLNDNKRLTENAFGVLNTHC